MRNELTAYLESGESVAFSGADLTLGRFVDKRTLTTRVILVISFLLLAWTVLSVVYGVARGAGLSFLLFQFVLPVLFFVIVATRMRSKHPHSIERVRNSTVVITDRRVFKAPPEEYFLLHSWEGPQNDEIIWLPEQLSASLSTYAARSGVVFECLYEDSQFGWMLTKHPIFVKELDDAFSALPAYLRQNEFVVRQKGESQKDLCLRARRFLDTRKARLKYKS